MQIPIHAQTSGFINTTSQLPLNSSLQEEKKAVQMRLADLLIKAINIGAEIPEIAGFDEHNATLYVKVKVNNSGERTANASDFYFTVNYQSEPASSGVTAMHGSDAGVIVRLPPSTFALMPQRLDTGDPAKNSLLDSFNRYDFAGDCNGKIDSGESKECIVTMSISAPSNKTSIATGISPQEQDD